MIEPGEAVPLSLTAAELNIVLAALSEMPFKVSAPVIERVRQQVLRHDVHAFDPPPRINGNGIDVVRD